MVKAKIIEQLHKKRARPKNLPVTGKETKCKHCSGFEDKLSIAEQTEIKEEITLMQKHEIIRQMSMCMGADIECLQHAEKLFDQFKYHITEYVLKHEFNCESNLSLQMVLWLEEKCCPDSAKSLHSVMGKYLHRDL
ncbi:MAG TPA: hypothetical protein PLY93_02415 [Turneriella sp.]|nr:hypothetical protein [Turneriella sp.]